jgi:hypothetical protein
MRPRGLVMRGGVAPIGGVLFVLPPLLPASADLARRPR